MTGPRPLSRIALGLVGVTTAILVGLDLAGLIPDHSREDAQRRLKQAEELLTQTSVAVSRNDLVGLRAMLEVSVGVNDEILSAGLRDGRGRLILLTRDHRRHWAGAPPDMSTTSYMRLPIQRDNREWATLELRFVPLATGVWWRALWERPALKLVAMTALLGFICYGVFMRRTLRYLDPSAVIPARVQTALDAMSEGVLLLDEEERIVLANEAFATKFDQPQSALLGVRPSNFGWRAFNSFSTYSLTPWKDAIETGAVQSPVTLVLDEAGEESIFQVKSAPVLGEWDRARGAIVTFNDVTELERSRRDLHEALTELEKSRDEIRLQNEELSLLARSDPLTGAANRRSFMEWLDERFTEAQGTGRALACFMADIDHFKRVNDDHGHAMGDEVIRRVAEALKNAMGPGDMVCRYGGEEFCVVATGKTAVEIHGIADGIRRTIAAPGFARIPITASFGVSSTECAPADPMALIDQADQALYASKNGGRNRVTRFDEISAKE